MWRLLNIGYLFQLSYWELALVKSGKNISKLHVELNDWKLQVKFAVLCFTRWILPIKNKTIKTIARSPIFTQLYSSLTGLTTLRVDHCQNYFQKDFDQYQDVHSSAWFLFFSSARWLSVRMDMIIVIYTAGVTYACVAMRESMTTFFFLNFHDT